MDTRLATRQIRMRQWEEIIKARNESGLSVKDYCAQNDISRDAYFYWLRKIREAAIETSGEKFAELSMPADAAIPAADPSTVIIEFNDLKIRVDDVGSRNTLAMVLEVLRNAQ